MFKAIIYDECMMKIIMIRLNQIVMIPNYVTMMGSYLSTESDEFRREQKFVKFR
jgi:riboflavin transporter FmnP